MPVTDSCGAGSQLEAGEQQRGLAASGTGPGFRPASGRDTRAIWVHTIAGCCLSRGQSQLEPDSGPEKAILGVFGIP